jgi:hypothetical protein
LCFVIGGRHGWAATGEAEHGEKRRGNTGHGAVS